MGCCYAINTNKRKKSSIAPLMTEGPEVVNNNINIYNNNINLQGGQIISVSTNQIIF